MRYIPEFFGCLPQDDYDLETVAKLQSNAVSLSTIHRRITMPVLCWDTAFEAFLERRGNVLEDMHNDGADTFPWDVYKRICNNSNNNKIAGQPLYFSQGSTPSCMGHADDFAYRSSLLTSIALGAELTFEPTDPYRTWYLSKGKCRQGGQSVGVMANFANRCGHVLAGSKTASKAHQSAVVFLDGSVTEIADKIRRCCRSGLGVALGNAAAVCGTVMDANGMSVAEFQGRWSHATSFNTWCKRNGQEYVYWTNSHGAIYKQGCLNEPKDGAWMRPDKELVTFLQTAVRYGMPYAVLSEGKNNA